MDGRIIMNEDGASLLIDGEVTESSKHDLINELKMLLQSPGKLSIDLTPRRRGCGSISAFIGAERVPYFDEPLWKLEVMITITEPYIVSLSEKKFDISDAIYDAYCFKAMAKTLRELMFEQESVFDNGTSVDFLYVKENISDCDEVAEIMFKLIQRFQSILNYDDIDSSKVDWSFVEKAEKLEGWKKKILKAFILALVSNKEPTTVADQKAGWRTPSGISVQLNIRRQSVYKYLDCFKALCEEKLLLKAPYKGPGRKQQSVWYKVNCDLETAQVILNIYDVHGSEAIW